jgi:hypothetical protein
MGLLFIPQMTYEYASYGGMILAGENRRTQRKTCSTATSFYTNPTLTDPGANPGFYREMPATYSPCHGRPIYIGYRTLPG